MLIRPVLLFSATVLFSGCSTDVPRASDDEAAPPYDLASDGWVNPPFLFEPFPEEEPERAEDNATILRRIDANPTSLNPIFNLPWQDHYCHTLLFINPFRRLADMSWVTNSDVVLSSTESEDHRVFTLKLNPEARWQDGKPWTAHDIEFSYSVIADDSVPALFYKRNAERLSSVRALDDHTVEFVHREALATRMRDMSFPIIPKHIFDNEAERRNDPTFRASEFFNHYNRDEVIGSGPYRLVEYRTNDRVIVERWDDYPFARPRFQRQILKIVPDTNIALLLFKKGELDETVLTGQQFATQTGDEEFRNAGVKVYGARRMVGGLAFNMDGSNPFFVDARVRRALSYAFDRERFLRTALYGVYPESAGMFEKTHWAHNSSVEPLPFDLERTSQLLDEAGWLADADDGWRYKTIDGTRTRFSFEVMMVPGVPSFKQMLDLFGRDLQRVGVEVRPLFIEGAVLTERLREHDMDTWINIVEVSNDPDEWSIYWSTDGYHNGYNWGGYSNSRVDELFQLARVELDREKRIPLYQQIQALVFEDQPQIWVYDYAMMWAFSNRMRGIELSPSGAILFYPGFTAWWKAKEPGAVPAEATAGG